MNNTHNLSFDLYGDDIGKVELVDYVGSDLTIVNSARVSFGKRKEELDTNDEKLIDYLIRHRHTSVLEHNFVTFRFKVPLFVRSQHHRHRTWSYNEISRRYTEENLQFYEPKQFRTQHKSNRQASNENELINPWIDESGQLIQGCRVEDAVKSHHQESVDLYNKMMDVGVCREQARGILPQNLYTEYYGSANLNNILKFVDLRTHEGAQWEIQRAAQAVLQVISELYPITVAAYQKIRNERYSP
jgi:thymidylate synthase (FAD)